MDNEKKLLLEISKLSARIKQINESTGGLFNIFDITSVSHDEVTICRVIYEFINPKGSHCQKGKYLKMFCEKVLGLDFSLEICNKATVYREYVIAENFNTSLAPSILVISFATPPPVHDSIVDIVLFNSINLFISTFIFVTFHKF